MSVILILSLTRLLRRSNNKNRLVLLVQRWSIRLLVPVFGITVTGFTLLGPFRLRWRLLGSKSTSSPTTTSKKKKRPRPSKLVATTKKMPKARGVSSLRSFYMFPCIRVRFSVSPCASPMPTLINHAGAFFSLSFLSKSASQKGGFTIN